MKIYVFDNEQNAAQFAASRIAADARNSVAERGSFSVALSGGTSPWPMLAFLAGEDMPWARVHIFQVDERVVPSDDPKWTFAKLRSVLLSRVPLPADNIHPMPVDMDDLQTAAESYERTLTKVLGSPPVLDLVHLGLGADGHTGSLVPQSPDVTNALPEVTVSPVYEGSRRITLTYSILSRARTILWFVLGEAKASALARLIAGDSTIPAGRIERSRAIVVADKAAAHLLKE
jgi:6-phosphogluconolactonase